LSEPDSDPWHLAHDGLTERFELAPRAVPGAKQIAAFLVFFGLVFGAILGSAFAEFLGPLGLIAGGLPIAVASAVGALVGWGRSEVHLGEHELVGVERCGPLRWVRRVPLRDLERLVVDVGMGQRAARPGSSDPLGGLATLSAIKADGAPGRARQMLALGHPVATLEALARALGERTGHPVEVRALTAPGRGLPLVSPAGELPEFPPELPPQPSRSTALLAREGDTVTIELPPRGFWRGSKGLGLFSVIWLAFVAVFGLISVGIGAAEGDLSTVLPFTLGTLLFGAIGVTVFVLALRAGKRRALVQVQAGALSIVQQALGEPVTHIWRAGEVTAIGVGPSGIRVNNVPILELQVHTTAGDKTGLFRERPDDELFWMAAVLEAALSNRS